MQKDFAVLLRVKMLLFFRAFRFCGSPKRAKGFVCLDLLLPLMLLFLSPIISERNCWAADKRYALLVANQVGWKKEPRLRYVIEGDLLPLQKSLTLLGFEVKVLKNQNANTLRKHLKQLKKEVKRKRVSTFLFYYSGHAGPKSFHLGRKTARPFLYEEFIQQVLSIPVSRRFVILDACFSGEVIRLFGSLKRFKKLFRQNAQGKGIRKKIRLDLKQYFPNQGLQSRSLQILSSSLSLSFESKYRKASAFTYHLLKGLKGRADLDQDGKISLGELFQYSQRQVKRETGQKPQRLLFSVGAETYGFAPVYKSRLVFSSGLSGEYQISSNNFLWRYKKRDSSRFILAVPTGKAKVEIRRKGRCYRQFITFMANRTHHLQAKKWKVMPCKAIRSTTKGKVQVSAMPATPSQLSMAFTFGLQNASFLGKMPIGGGGWSFRSGFLGLRTGLWTTVNTFGDIPHWQLATLIDVLLGIPFDWKYVSLFCGGYIGGLLLWQDVNVPNTKFGLLFRAGAELNSTFWFSQQWGVDLSLQVGFVMGRLQRLVVFGDFGAHTGIRYRF